MNDFKFKEYPIDNKIKRALSELGFRKPLKVQEITFPLIMEEKDLIVQSQTGSGKTAAFAIPICEKVDLELEATQVLVLAPTRELAVQVGEDFMNIGKYKGITGCTVYGKQPIQEQRKLLKAKPHVVVSTPGRMMDHVKRKNIKLDQVKYLVIDEADEMLIMGFKEQLETILKKLPVERVTLLFSATIPRQVELLADEFMKRPENIAIEPETPTIEKIEQIYYGVDGFKKLEFLKKMFRHERPEKAIIFCNTREKVDVVFESMRKWNTSICAVHGGMDQGARLARVAAFKRGEYKFMVSTDVTGRGLHINGITHVVNYSVPFEDEGYVHRIGRTGRVEENGIAITLVSEPELPRFLELQEYLGYEIPCKGGMITKKRRQKETKRSNQRYKVDNQRKSKAVVKIMAGRANSRLKAGDILGAIRSVNGISSENIGKINIRDKETSIEIFDGKEDMVIRAFKTKAIRGKIYRFKRG